MAEINIAYLEYRLSGGAANTNQNSSLGGIMSSQRIFSKSVSGISTITGVVLDDAPGSIAGNGTLTYTASGTTLAWTPNGGTIGTAQDVSSDGRYALFDFTESQALFVTVTAASLPGTDQTDTIAVAALLNKTFDDISKSESFHGDDEYRGYYLYNAHATEPFLGPKLFIHQQPTGADTLEVGIDAAGVGDGSTTGVAVTIADESTAPVGVTFSAPADSGAGISLPDLAASQAHGWWQHRTVAADTLVSTPADASAVAFYVGY